MPADLTEIRALLASLRGFTPGPWIALEYAANDAAVAIAETDPDKHEHPGALIVGQTDARDARLIAAAPTLHATCLHLFAEVARLTAELSKPVARGWCQSEVTERAHRDVGDYAASVRTEVTPDGPPWGWKIWHKVTFEVLMSGPETGDAGKRAADLALVAAGYRLIGGVHPLPSEVSNAR